MNGVRGYKVFNPDWTWRGKKYSCPGTFEEDVELEIYKRGMHFCKKLSSYFDYYKFNPKSKVVEVIAYGEVITKGNISVTNKLKIIREISGEEVLKLMNIGKKCSGRCNSGDYNSGDWNKCSFSNGCFNTEEPKIYLFNKPTDWTYRDWIYSAAKKIMEGIPSYPIEYVLSRDMTNEEKAEHPEAEITGGYLKKSYDPKKVQDWWNNLLEEERKTVKSLPNFDAKIFREFTGIEVGKDD